MTKSDDIIIDTRDFEVGKFTADANYHAALEQILELGHEPKDYLHHGNAFAGFVTLARTLSLYEIYKKTMDLSGHIAEIGVWKGSSFLLWAKLVSIFEPHSNTLVHGFDWFEGVKPGPLDQNVVDGKCKTDYQQLRDLIDLQEIGHIARLHKLDVTKDLDEFFEVHSGAKFKIVFLDAGIYDVVNSTIQYFWERLNTGGILVLDEYNYQSSPGEAVAVRELLPDQTVHSIPWTRTPSGYIIKK
jgi:hypothetical protein